MQNSHADSIQKFNKIKKSFDDGVSKKKNYNPKKSKSNVKNSQKSY